MASTAEEEQAIVIEELEYLLKEEPNQDYVDLSGR